MVLSAAKILVKETEIENSNKILATYVKVCAIQKLNNVLTEIHTHMHRHIGA